MGFAVTGSLSAGTTAYQDKLQSAGYASSNVRTGSTTVTSNTAVDQINLAGSLFRPRTPSGRWRSSPAAPRRSTVACSSPGSSPSTSPWCPLPRRHHRPPDPRRSTGTRRGQRHLTPARNMAWRRRELSQWPSCPIPGPPVPSVCSGGAHHLDRLLGAVKSASPNSTGGCRGPAPCPRRTRGGGCSSDGEAAFDADREWSYASSSASARWGSAASTVGRSGGHRDRLWVRSDRPDAATPAAAAGVPDRGGLTRIDHRRPGRRSGWTAPTEPAPPSGQAGLPSPRCRRAGSAWLPVTRGGSGLVSASATALGWARPWPRPTVATCRPHPDDLPSQGSWPTAIEEAACRVHRPGVFVTI